MDATTDRLDLVASRVLAAADAGARTPPLTDEFEDFTIDDAHEVSARVAELRAARGESPVGWKIGFTNRTIWDEYGVRAPIWGPMYDTTVAAVHDPSRPFAWPLGKLVQPRVEPEILFRLRAAPTPDMDESALLDVVDGVAHGFEIVQSIYPGWLFRAADTVAAFALHGACRHGPFTPVDGLPRETWLELLTRFEISLSRNGEDIDRGQAANVLGGPLSALKHFVSGLESDPRGRRLKPGDIVTTGTVTRAFPVAPGERWTSRIDGLPVSGLTADFQA